MLRRRLQQLSCVINAGTFGLLLSLLLAHVLLRKYLPNVATHGTQNLDFFFEGDQEGDDQQHPPFLIDWRVVAGTALAFLVSCAVDVGGLAGGGLLVPIFYQTVGFGLKASTGLSQAAIAGASAAALAANLFRAQLSTGNPAAHDWHNQHHLQHHHQQQQPLVDLDLVLLLTPGLLLGVAVGAVMNDLLPEWVISAALVGVLWLSCYKTAVRGLLTWHAEAQAEASLAAAAAISSAPQPLLRPILTTGGGGAAGAAGRNAPSRGDSSSRGGSSRGGSPQVVSCGGSPQQHSSHSHSSSVCGFEGSPAVATAAGEAGKAPATAAATATAAADSSSSTPEGGSAVPQELSPPPPPTAAASPPPPPAAAAKPMNNAADTSTMAVSAAASASDSDSSSSPSGAGLQHQHSTPIYECKTKLLSPAGQQTIHRAAAAAAAGGRPASRLARTGLYPGWFSPPSEDEQEGDATAASGSGGGGVGGPTAAWRPLSRNSSAGGLGYIITDRRLPAWQQQQQQHGSSSGAAAAAAAAALQQQLQQLWLWLPPVHLEQIPWMKLFGLWAVWLGCMGLTALSGLLPFCSWAYVTYLLLFTSLTGFVTVLLIRVLLVEPLLGAQQVCLLSLKLQQFVHKHSSSQGTATQQHSEEASWVDDVEANQQQPHQHSALRQPLLLHGDRPEQQRREEESGEQGGAAAGGGAAATGAVRAALTRAGWSASRWLHVLTGFGKAPDPAVQQQQQQEEEEGEEEVNQHHRGAGDDTQHLEDSTQPQEQQQKLSLFSQMRLKQQQQQAHWGFVQPPICPVAAATDSYFFSATSGAAAAVNGQLDSRPARGGPRPTRVLAAPSAVAVADDGSSSSSRQGGMGGIWAGLKRVLWVQPAAAGVQPTTETLDPFDGNEQPWRYEEPFPVAAAAAASLAGGPAPSLAAAAAAAGGSSGSSALVTIAAAAAVVSVAAGVLTGITGVASSALFMPILLDFRVHTQVAMASTVMLVFLSSSAASLSFILQGRLIGTYALLFALVGLCGGCVGVSMVGALLRLARRPSIVVLVIAGALAAAGLSCAVSGVWGFAHAWEEGHVGFRALCQQ